LGYPDYNNSIKLKEHDKKLHNTLIKEIPECSPKKKVQNTGLEDRFFL